MRPWLALLCLCVTGLAAAPLSSSKNGATDWYFLDHIAESNWTTTITIYNDGFEDVTVTLHRWDPSGVETTLPGIVVPAEGTTMLSNGDFGYSGCGALAVPEGATIQVKLAYRYQDSHSLCEFFIPPNHTGTEWMLPNPYQAQFDWFGMALANMGATDAEVTLTAWKDGAVVATETITLSPHIKQVGIADAFWSGLGYADVDRVTITSDNPIPAPLSITGNNEQDRHVFFLADLQRESVPGSCWFFIPHVAKSNWTTRITVYNPVDYDIALTFRSWMADSSADVVDQPYTIPAHGTVTLEAGTDFAYGGTALIEADCMVHVKLTYRYQDSDSLCEFFIEPAVSRQWLIPNSIHDWFHWFGLAFANINGEEITVALDAYKNGVYLDTAVMRVMPFTKVVALSSELWPNISKKSKGADYADVDMVVVRSSKPIPAPISITGNNEQDRHVFFQGAGDTLDGTFPDRAFRAYVLENFDTDQDGTISQSEADAVTMIDTPGQYGQPGGIRSIDGVEIFRNLAYLQCNYEQLCWLPDLSSLTRLETIWANDNRLIEVRDEHLPDSIMTLGLSHNHLTELGLSTPRTEMTRLYLDHNDFATFPDVSGMTQLEQLDVSWNQLTEIPSLTGFPELTRLAFHHNQVTDFPDITGLTKLTQIDCWNNELTSLPDLSAFSELTWLNCSFNSDIPAIPGLASLTNLQTLDCSYTSVSDVSGVQGLTQLTNFQCSNTGVTILPDLSALTNLQMLTIANTAISEIPGLASLTSLRTLTCVGSAVSDLSGIASCTSIKYLYVNSCPIASLPDLSGLDTLQRLECANCLLTDVPDVTGCASIDYLRCPYNYFGSDDCAMIQAIEAMGLSTFIYNPQNDGSTLTCP